MPETTQYHYESAEGLITDSYLIPILDKLISTNNPKTALDLGCGNGSLAKYFIEKGYEFYGIDASEQGITYAKEMYPDRFFLQDISDNELPEALRHKKFDLILSTEVIEHVYSPVQFMQFCHKHLRQEGLLVISTPYHGYLKNLILTLSGKMDDHFTALWEGGHIKFWSRKTLSKLMEDHGFKVMGFFGAGRLPYLWKSMIITARKS